MDTPEITSDVMAAGAEFDASLASLGLRAHMVMWGYDEVVGHHVLMVMTDFTDLHGPLQVMELVFKAYNASLLPKEIDPFNVRVHSIAQPIAVALMERAVGGWVQKADKATGKVTGPRVRFEEAMINGVHVKKRWIVKIRNLGSRKEESVRRQFKSFRKRVLAQAA